jgi:SAM-dependent methyltransferase
LCAGSGDLAHSVAHRLADVHAPPMSHTTVVVLEHCTAIVGGRRPSGRPLSRTTPFRPGYPHAPFDDLLAEHVGTALDVGCGTGQVAVELRRRRVSVLGVDPDPRMAAVAVGHGVDVEVSELERWEDGGRRFDLITSGHAWHWVDLSTGADTAARVLRPAGTPRL